MRHLSRCYRKTASLRLAADLLLARCLHEHDLRSERRVELVRPECASMDRPGDKFPERLKILERRLVWIVIVRGRIMHIGCEPHSIAHCGVFDKGQDVR